MAAASLGQWITRQGKLLLAFLTIALDVWAIWQVARPERPVFLVEAGFGTPEYVAAAIFLTLTTVALLTACSHQFWPRVRFTALHSKIAQCRDEASVIHDDLGCDADEITISADTKYVARFLDRMAELQAALHLLDIGLSIGELDEEGTAHMRDELRSLAARAQAGDIRGARSMYSPEQS